MLNLGTFSQPSRRRTALLAGGAALVLMSAGGASAQDDGAVSELVVTARNYVPTTNTAATKVAIPLVETPQSISVITRDQIDVLNMQNLQQAVRYTAGIVSENYGPDERFDWLTLRGFQPVEYVDGLLAASGTSSTAGLDLWGAESIEVLKGPSGVLYGQSPPGGIVNYTSRRPQDEFHAELQGQIGNRSAHQVSGDVTGPLSASGAVSGRLTALWREHDTQVYGAHSRRVYVAPALTLKAGEDTKLTLLTFYQKDVAHGGDGGFLPAQGTFLPNPLGKIPVSFNAGEPDYNLFSRKQYGAGYEFTHAFSEHVSFIQNLKFTHQDENFLSVYGTGLDADNRTLNRSNFGFPENIKSFAVDSRFELRGATGAIEHTVLAGLDYRRVRNKTDFIFGSAPSIDIFAPVYGKPIPAPSFVSLNYVDSVAKQTGFYAQDSMKLDNWRLTVSARHDRLTGVVKDNATTYRVGLNYISDIGLAPYVAYATSFLPTTGADFGGAAFKPSKGKQVEAGLKYEPHLGRDVNLFASGAVYSLTQENVLTNDPAHTFFSVQTGEVEVKGLELEAVARIHERVSVNASYSYTDTEVTKSNGADLGKQLPIVPKTKASLLVDYTAQTGPLAGAGAGVGVRYLGSSYGDAINTFKSSDQTLFDLILHYDFHDWRLALNANNLFDKVYVQRCSDLTQCFYSQRRTVLVSLDRKW